MMHFNENSLERTNSVQTVHAQLINNKEVDELEQR